MLLMGESADAGLMREGTMGSRPVRVLEGGPRLLFNPPRIYLSEPWLCSVRSFWPSYKRKIGSVGQVSDFRGPEKEARRRELFFAAQTCAGF